MWAELLDFYSILSKGANGAVAGLRMCGIVWADQAAGGRDTSRIGEHIYI